MRVVTMDDEAAELVHAGLEMSHAALEARARRVDPEGIISNSYAMSRIKTKDVLRQLEAPPLIEFHELEMKERNLAMTLASALLAAETEEMRDVIWRKFRLVVFLRSPVTQDRIAGPTIDNPSQEELRIPKTPTKPKKVVDSVQSLSAGKSPRNTPHSKAV